MIEQIAIKQTPGGAPDSLEVTLRGEPTALIHALVNGLPREVLLALNDAIAAELAARAVDRK